MNFSRCLLEQTPFQDRESGHPIIGTFRCPAQLRASLGTGFGLLQIFSKLSLSFILPQGSLGFLRVLQGYLRVPQGFLGFPRVSFGSFQLLSVLQSFFWKLLFLTVTNSDVNFKSNTRLINLMISSFLHFQISYQKNKHKLMQRIEWICP